MLRRGRHLAGLYASRECDNICVVGL